MANLKTELESRIEDAKGKNGMNERGGFVDEAFLIQLFTKEKLRKHYDGFYEKQWYLPPSLSSAEIQHFPPALFKFPFLEKPHHVGGGGYGIVMKTKIPEEYMRLPNGMRKRTTVAYKKIKIPEPLWGIYNAEVKTLQAREHPNITPLLGCFVAGLENPNMNAKFSEECLYMLSPLADMDMDVWMTTEGRDKHPYFKDMDHDGLRRHILDEAILGIIQGVTYIHREIEGVVGYHRDLKPKNILLFHDNGAWTWRICDFGCGNLKSPDNTGTYNPITSERWAPPEVQKDIHSTEVQTHGRPHDVYSLGCVFLLLVTMIEFQWQDEGLKSFEGQRRKEDNKTMGAFHNSPNATQKWIKSLHERAPDQQIREVLTIIEEMMAPRERRITTWEAQVYLYATYPDRQDQDVVQRIEDVIQESRTIDLAMKETPVSRATKWGVDGAFKKAHVFRGTEFLDVLKRARWYDSSPQTTEQLAKRAKRVQKYFSNLPKLPGDEPLFGCQSILDDVSKAFSKKNTVAIYGLAGTGKSQLALTYASQLSKLDLQLRKHTFWISAADLHHDYH
ncbi:kinase-like protein [Massarina eburnea CBS 473.64]|uniref:Kinase-like protein n=1 Tax=Massarina eburnea CBS 473.64 TaxID=1395130 RepID=A0A6A6S3Q1_9PLEO|nr:kinase-like protein [Massarina eburnea CBS 473.64]